MKTPIEMTLDGVQWRAAGPRSDSGDGLPWATHEGVFDIAGVQLRCYRLNDGRAIFNAEDFHAFFNELLASGLQGSDNKMGDRQVPFKKDAICDCCGKAGAFDFMGDLLCDECADIPAEGENANDL